MSPIVTLLTDFGTDDAYVGIMKGIVLGICPDARLVDLAHGIPAQDVFAGALVLRSAVDAFPAGTIHLAIVDPGVGTARGAILVETPRATFIGPDNGVLVPAAKSQGISAVRTIENPSLFRHPVSATFHGRDVFAPAAGAVAAGMDPAKIGPEASGFVELVIPDAVVTPERISGCVVHVDRFGNLVTNIDAAALSGGRGKGWMVTCKGRALGGIRTTYGSVDPGEAVVLIGSWGAVEIAVCGGSASRTFDAGVGDAVTIEVA